MLSYNILSYYIVNIKSYQHHVIIMANYNNSLTWNKAILGWFPLLTMIPGLGRSEVVIICPDWYQYHPPSISKHPELHHGCFAATTEKRPRRTAPCGRAPPWACPPQTARPCPEWRWCPGPVRAGLGQKWRPGYDINSGQPRKNPKHQWKTIGKWWFNGI